MQHIRRNFKTVDIIHYTGMASMFVAVVFAAFGAGAAWIIAKADGGCEVYMYSRSFTANTKCSGLGIDSSSYYSCNEKFCSPCQRSGEAALCFAVFGIIVGCLSILMMLKRVFRDPPKDFGGRHIKLITAAMCLSVGVFKLLSWLIFVSGCEGNLGDDFNSSAPHTGFVLMFLAMCLAGLSLVCTILAFDPLQQSQALQDQDSQDNGDIGITAMQSEGLSPIAAASRTV